MIGEKIHGECPSCRQETDFTYKGVQELVDKHDIYDCNACWTTIAYGTFMEHQNKKNGAQRRIE
jgi:hypothetical protein